MASQERRLTISDLPPHAKKSFAQGLIRWPDMATYSISQKHPARALCDRCKKIFAKGKVSPGSLRPRMAHPSANSIVFEAKGGCPLCALLLASLRKRTIYDSKLWFSFVGDPQNCRLKFMSGKENTVVRFHLHWIPEDASEINSVEDQSQDTDSCVTISEKGSTSSPSSLLIIRQWYNYCIKKHNACHRLNPAEEKREAWNPTRLLDLGIGVIRSSCNARRNVRLVLGKDLPGSISYTALSHCWGKLQHLRLKKCYLAKFRQGIAAEELSKTFQDAIAVTRSLGIRYLWIDSICIIQDSEEDWRAESSLMDKVYRFCQCCIAATAAKDGRAGCFIESDLQLLKIPRATPLQSAYDRRGQSTSPGHYECSDTDIWNIEVEESPLSKRAWAHQERLLAHRVLHFGASRVFWECRERRTCGYRPTRMKLRIPSRKPLEMKALKAPLLGPDTMPSHRKTAEEHAYNFWDDTIEAYAIKDLTREEDKLVAISGIAKKVQDVVKDEYVAGLWKRNMIYGLLWRRVDRWAPMPQNWRAPSWSWASTTGPIHMHRKHTSRQGDSIALDREEMEKCVRIRKITVQPAGEDPLGQITDAHLTVEGFLAPAVLKSKCRQGYWLDSRLKVGYGKGSYGYVAHDDNISPDLPIESGDQNLFCIPLLGSSSGKQAMLGLLVVPVTGYEIPNAYYRYGTFRVKSTEVWAKDMTKACDLELKREIKHERGIKAKALKRLTTDGGAKWTAVVLV